MTFTSIKMARNRLMRMQPVYCLFTDEQGTQQRWRLADAYLSRKKSGFVQLLDIHGREALIQLTAELFDDGSR